MLPFSNNIEFNTINNLKTLPLIKEIAWDFNKDTPIIEYNTFKIVTGDEAIKVWVYKALKTERYKYLIYSWNYGSELETLIGYKYPKDLLKPELDRYIKECLSVNPYILNITLEDIILDKGSLQVNLTLDTIYNTGVSVIV